MYVTLTKQLNFNKKLGNTKINLIYRIFNIRFINELIQVIMGNYLIVEYC